MVFLLAVLLTAMSFGIWPAIFASVLSFLVYNFFFIPPLYTFTIAEPYELLALVIFLVVAVISSALGRPRARAGEDFGQPHARHAPAVRVHAAAFRPGDARCGGGRCRQRNPCEPRTCRWSSCWRKTTICALTAAWPPEDALDAAAMTAARWAYSHGEPAGADTGTLPIIPWYFVPLRIGAQDPWASSALPRRKMRAARFGSARPAGYIGRADRRRARSRIACARNGERENGDRNRARAQYAACIGVARFPHAAVVDPRFRHQPDRLGDKLDAAAKKDLLGQIKTEAEDLDEMVRNLLAITRIDAGALELRRDWIDLREIAERVVNAARRHGARSASTSGCRRPAAGAGRCHLGRAGDRKCRRQRSSHTPPETRIMVDANVTADAVTLRVTDDGPGIPADGCRISSRNSSKARTCASADGGARHRAWPCHRQGHHGGPRRRIAAESPVERPRRALHHDVSARKAPA